MALRGVSAARIAFRFRFGFGFGLLLLLLSASPSPSCLVRIREARTAADCFESRRLHAAAAYESSNKSSDAMLCDAMRRDATRRDPRALGESERNSKCFVSAAIRFATLRNASQRSASVSLRCSASRRFASLFSSSASVFESPVYSSRMRVRAALARRDAGLDSTRLGPESGRATEEQCAARSTLTQFKISHRALLRPPEMRLLYERSTLLYSACIGECASSRV